MELIIDQWELAVAVVIASALAFWVVVVMMLDIVRPGKKPPPTPGKTITVSPEPRPAAPTRHREMRKAEEQTPAEPPYARIYRMRALLAVVSLGCVLGMLFVPPWSGGTRDDTDRRNPTTEYWIAYTPIVDPPDSDVPIGVNWGVLALQLAFCAVATGVLWFLAGWDEGRAAHWAEMVFLVLLGVCFIGFCLAWGGTFAYGVINEFYPPITEASTIGTASIKPKMYVDPATGKKYTIVKNPDPTLFEPFPVATQPGRGRPITQEEWDAATPVPEIGETVDETYLETPKKTPEAPITQHGGRIVSGDELRAEIAAARQKRQVADEAQANSPAPPKIGIIKKESPIETILVTAGSIFGMWILIWIVAIIWNFTKKISGVDPDTPLDNPPGLG